MESHEIRASFLRFFETKQHKVLPSASLIPVDDPTLLLIGAGMAPFKPYYKGEAQSPFARIATCQKCVRADDIEKVGKTSRHHTFFEMLGNFSFGDYFKEEAITWAWEYVIEWMKLPREKLWITIHTEDDEAHKIWNERIGIPPDRILRFTDNFWGPIGASGPCGPCTEIFIDRGADVGCRKPECAPGCDCDRYTEFWNLVFPGLNRLESGQFIDLPRKGIDTGMGLERLTMVLQNVDSPFETDLFKGFMDILRDSEKETPQAASLDPSALTVSRRIIADHLRAVVFMIGDGIPPGNEGRGYVLRRIFRRGMRFSRLLGVTEPFTRRLIPELIRTMKKPYPELGEKESYILKLVDHEEQAFQRTLRDGEKLLRSFLLPESINKVLVTDLAEQIGGLTGTQPAPTKKQLPGDVAFKLYDTFGFPFELTQEMAQEKGFLVDAAGFHKSIEVQRERARADLARKLSVSADISLLDCLKGASSTFVGYETLKTQARVLLILSGADTRSELREGEEAQVVLDWTPFYAEAGGQVGDRGVISWSGGRAVVLDTTKGTDGIHRHLVKVAEGTLLADQEIEASVDEARRRATERHHTATHLLHAALRELVGKHVAQAGSLVEPARLRFDFSHTSPLTPEEIRKIERMVSEKVLKDIPVRVAETTIEEARALGAMALFDEKYAELVRMVEVEGFSRELCGGTHVGRTGEIGLVKIVSEEAVGTGLRRIEAVAGTRALELLETFSGEIRKLSETLKVEPATVVENVKRLQDRARELEKQVESLSGKLAHKIAEFLVGRKEILAGISVILIPRIPEPGSSKELADSLREMVGSGLIVLGDVVGGAPVLTASVTQDLVTRGVHAGQIVKLLTARIGGKGGGRPNFATGGGGDQSLLSADLLKAVVQEALESLTAKQGKH